MKPPLFFKRGRSAFCFVAVILIAALAAGQVRAAPVLRAAAVTFSNQPVVGSPADYTAADKTIQRVIGDLKTTLVLFDCGDTQLCFITSPFPINGGPLQIATRSLVAKELGLPFTSVVASSSHDHCVPLIKIQNPRAWGQPGDYPPKSESNELGRKFLEGMSIAARGLRAKLAPVTIEWGIAQESRLTYNRRGKRADGTSYFIREEDRVKLGPDYIGLIDPDAMVVVLRGADDKPVAALAFYTGHPVTAYNPEVPVAFGQWPQVACEKLSAHLGGVPVAFIQGSAGDINSKYMLSGTVAQAIELGGFLGDSFVKAADTLHKSARTDLAWERTTVGIPLAELPSAESLKRDLATIDDFVHRGRAGDPNTLFCVGMNFPLALTPPYRAQLVQLVRPWYVWALDQRESGLAASLPKEWPLPVVVARIGDVGFVGMPWEAFTRTARQLKEKAPLPCVLTATYIDGAEGYIPDATACDDREYQAGYFRYLWTRPPYKAPGGDAVVGVAVSALERLSK
ncbi:MAG: hypothetical protein JWM32_2150 [Verrucomicrobia bacterium]|nr:hypothetical protein [Verrucomicrobiota bacterium]